MLRLWINFSGGWTRIFGFQWVMECCILGQKNDAEGIGAHFVEKKEVWLGFMSRLLFFKPISISLFFFFCSNTLDNVIFKLAIMKKRCVHICEQLREKHTANLLSFKYKKPSGCNSSVPFFFSFGKFYYDHTKVRY